MSTIESPPVERRSSVRISPKGSVVVLAGEHVEPGRVANLSSSGLLAITSGSPSEISVGAEVEIELRLDAGSSEWLRLAGRVVRVDGRAIAFAFAAGSEPFAQLISASVSASGEHQLAWSVVLIDAAAERRGRLAEAFRTAGCVVVEVSTPLEAIVRLGESPFEPELVAIGDSLPSSVAGDLRSFIEREHPRAKLVTVGDDVVAPPGPSCWLSASDEDGDLPARIRELLRR